MISRRLRKRVVHLPVVSCLFILVSHLWKGWCLSEYQGLRGVPEKQHPRLKSRTIARFYVLGDIYGAI